MVDDLPQEEKNIDNQPEMGEINNNEPSSYPPESKIYSQQTYEAQQQMFGDSVSEQKKDNDEIMKDDLAGSDLKGESNQYKPNSELFNNQEYKPQENSSKGGYGNEEYQQNQPEKEREPSPKYGYEETQQKMEINTKGKGKFFMNQEEHSQHTPQHISIGDESSGKLFIGKLFINFL